MSNQHKKQPADAGSAGSSACLDSTAPGSAKGNQGLSESNLDTVTGGAGSDGWDSIPEWWLKRNGISSGEATTAGSTPEPQAKPTDGTN